MNKIIIANTDWLSLAPLTASPNLWPVRDPMRTRRYGVLSVCLNNHTSRLLGFLARSTSLCTLRVQGIGL